MDFYTTKRRQHSILIECVTKSHIDELRATDSTQQKQWLSANLSNIKVGQHILVPNEMGDIERVLVIVDLVLSIWSIADLSTRLPAGDYHLSDQLNAAEQHKLILGWGLGAYQYTRFKEAKVCACLFVNPALDLAKIEAQLQATFITRDLVNAPANEMLPSHLAIATQQLADQYDAQFEQIIGDQLLTENYPLIHAVGRASTDAPRYLRLRWGQPTHPHIAIVGKGVCFDSGGLDIKPSSGMRWMKKDMGGAAHALGLASYIMQTQLPVYIDLAIPAVENAIAGNAFRPGDVISARNGTYVEIDNTDAEGRLVMADAITDLTATSQPELLIDFSTLTGAARVAAGTEVGVYFSNHDQLATQLQAYAGEVEDDIWRLPLHQGYRHMLDSSIADMVNCASSGFGGAITAALFLQEFFVHQCDWLHFDIMAYNMRTRAGRPKGGEAMGLRAVCEYLDSRYRCD